MPYNTHSISKHGLRNPVDGAQLTLRSRICLWRSLISRWWRDGAVGLVSAAGLDASAEDSGGAAGGESAFACLFAALVVDVFEIEGVEVAGDVAAGC